MEHQPQYDVAIEEIHHTEKLDAPSGTAIKTAEVMLGELSRNRKWQLAGSDDTSHASGLLITAKREPHVPGTHVVTYTSDADEIQTDPSGQNPQGLC
jgi:4-hydroxy-tetrahydrodipicolinate reductase